LPGEGGFVEVEGHSGQYGGFAVTAAGRVAQPRGGNAIEAGALGAGYEQGIGHGGLQVGNDTDLEPGEE
jgi:hypothetical protein